MRASVMLLVAAGAAVLLAAGGPAAWAAGWSRGYSGFSGGYSSGGYSGFSGGYSSGGGGYSGYSASGYSGGWSGSGYTNQSPYSTDTHYAGQDTLTMTLGGQTVALQANEWAAQQGPSGYGYGNTVSSISTNQLSASQLAALQAVGFSVSNGQVVISPTAYGGGLPSGSSISYNGGTTDLYGGNGALTLNVPGAAGGSGGGYNGGSYTPPPPPPAPTICCMSVGPNPAYPGQTVTVTVATTNANSVSLSLLSGGSESLSGSSSWSGAFAAPGPGNYTLTATASGSGGSASTSGVLTVQTPAPTAAFSVSPNPVQILGGLSFQDESAAGAGASISREQWTITSVKGRQAWNAASPPTCACFTQPGDAAGGAGPQNATYTATLTVWNNYGETASVSHSLTVTIPAPSASFSMSPNPVIAGWQSVAYRDGSSAGGSGLTISSEWWTMTGPGGTWSGGSPSALPSTFSTPGTYSVGLTVTNSYGVSASTSHPLTVRAAPTLAISVTPSTAQPGQTVTVSASWSGWTSASIDVAAFGGGTWPQSGSGTWNRPFTVTSGGTYSACITGTLAGQTRQACASATVLAPTAPILTQ